MRKNKTLIWGFALFCLLAAVSSVSAASYGLKEVTPVINKAIVNRQGRYEILAGLKSQNNVGEDNRGYVKALGGGAQVEAVVAAENEDRRFIYENIAQQNNLGPEGLATIESVFAEVQREKAKPGESIQLPDGQWTKK